MTELAEGPELMGLADLLGALGPRSPSHLVSNVLAAARVHLGLELAFVAETREGAHVVRYTDGAAIAVGVTVGQRRVLEETVCGLVLDRRLPELIADAWAVPGFHGYPFRSYAGVPITLADGTTFGMLCVVDRRPRRLRSRHTSVLRLLAEVIAQHLEDGHASWAEHCTRLVGVADVLDGDEPTIVHQRIVDLDTMRPVGAEALARFATGPERSPDNLFRDAWSVGYGTDLEMRALRHALATLSSLPTQQFLSVNVSPKLPLLDAFSQVLADYPVHRVVLEITEHSRVDDPRTLLHSLVDLRDRGLRVAVDDAGAGFAGLNRILDLEPDFIKLDATLVQNINTNPTRASLARSLVMFAHGVGSTIIAEGVETQSQADVLRDLGVRHGQGYLFGRPAAPQPVHP